MLEHRRDAPPVAQAALLACAVALACPGGTAFAASFPVFLWRAHGALAPRAAHPAWPMLVAGTAAAGLTGAELAVGLDTSAQSSALLSLVASTVLAGLAPDVGAVASAAVAAPAVAPPAAAPPEAAPPDALQQRRAEALRLRRSWDARLSWRVRKAAAAAAPGASSRDASE